MKQIKDEFIKIVNEKNETSAKPKRDIASILTMTLSLIVILVAIVIMRSTSKRVEELESIVDSRNVTIEETTKEEMVTETETETVSIEETQTETTTEKETETPKKTVKKQTKATIEETVVVETEPVPVEIVKATNFEIDYIAKCTWAEAGNQPELGIRYVIDCILNLADINNVSVIEAINTYFNCAKDGNMAKATPTEHIYKLVNEELANRTSYEVLYFRTKHFHTFGTPFQQIGDHYFSTK